MSSHLQREPHGAERAGMWVAARNSAWPYWPEIPLLSSIVCLILVLWWGLHTYLLTARSSAHSPSRPEEQAVFTPCRVCCVCFVFLCFLCCPTLLHSSMISLELSDALKHLNIRWIIEKAREFQKTSTSALLTMPKPLAVWITTNCGKFLKRWEYQNIWLAS